MIGEFFGTMVLILFGDGCVASFALFNKLGSPTPFANEWIVIILGWGLAVMPVSYTHLTLPTIYPV
ncbi:MAG TPA: hypothetical protein DCK85_07450 [Ktedonobacter sp.]|nr:hypothetical protein [Ktedonobacter sp.]